MYDYSFIEKIILTVFVCIYIAYVLWGVYKGNQLKWFNLSLAIAFACSILIKLYCFTPTCGIMSNVSNIIFWLLIAVPCIIGLVISAMIRSSIPNIVLVSLLAVIGSVMSGLYIYKTIKNPTVAY